MGEDAVALPYENAPLSLLESGEDDGEGDDEIEDAGEAVRAVGKE